MQFEKTKIELNSEIVADVLKIERRKKSLNLEEVSSILKIDKKYLKALEDGAYQCLPRGVYGKNFLREYLIFLGINPKEYLKALDNDFVQKKGVADKKVFVQKVVKDRNFFLIPKAIKNVFIFGFVVVCVIYLLVYARNIVSAPELIVTSPKENISISERNIIIKGKTEKEVVVEINNEIVLTNSINHFEKKVNLKEGVNIVKIMAKKKYSKESEIIRKIIVK